MQDTTADGEPTIMAQASEPEERVNRFLEHAASMLTSIVAIFLIVFVLIALVGVVTGVATPLLHGHSFTQAALEGLDSVFLAIILLELLHTTLSRGSVTRQVQEFIAIGITAGVRSGLEVAATSRSGNQREAVTALAINALGVLVLVVALWLVRQRIHIERRGNENDP